MSFFYKEKNNLSEVLFQETIVAEFAETSEGESDEFLQ